MMPETDPAHSRVIEEVAAVRDLPRADLIERWAKIYGRPPPKGISRRLLEHAVAYHIQAKAFGGLSPATQRKLDRLGADRRRGRSARPSKPNLSLTLGTRLVREWHGRVYTVEVVASGFLCDGERYRSLSEIARAITGTRWSGPRFFSP